MRTVSANDIPLSLIKLKDEAWLEKQRVAGKVAAGALMLLESLVKDRSSLTLLEMNTKAEEYICDHGCSCTFKGYKGFPAGVCISLDREGGPHQLVHGVPAAERLQEGDLVSFDLGATYPANDNKGAIADTALTCCFGEPKHPSHLQLIRDCEDILMKSIATIRVGERLGVIGQAIYRTARDKGYGLIVNYGGHSLDYETPHAQPFVANKSDPNEGIRLQKGLTLAIEPMIGFGSTTTWVSDDGWTVNTFDAFCHFEHTIFIHEDYVEVITHRNTQNILKSGKASLK